jgi:hypothetical protein
MTATTRKRNTRKNQIVAVAAGSAVIVAVYVVRRKCNIKLEAAVSDAVQDWVNQNAKAGFKTYLLDDTLIRNINALTNDALPLQAA